MGDVVLVEPACRYAIEELYKGRREDVKFCVTTEYPRIFKHFEKYPNVIVSNTWKAMDKGKPYHWAVGHPPFGHPFSMAIPYQEMHNQQFGSLALLRKTLKPEEYQIRLEVTPEDRLALYAMLRFPCDTDRPNRVHGAIAVHPGSGWASKTFPVSWWNEVLNALAFEGFTVILFGKSVSHEHGVLPVDVPARGIDLRNKLSLGQLFALIESCPATLSNDSAPTHIAGAFDNWYFMIATCKRPDLVFPFRRGSVQYKNKAIYRKLTVDALPMLPSDPTPQCIKDVIGGDILTYLPEPEEVARAISSTPWND